MRSHEMVIKNNEVNKQLIKINSNNNKINQQLTSIEYHNIVKKCIGRFVEIIVIVIK